MQALLNQVRGKGRAKTLLLMLLSFVFSTALAQSSGSDILPGERFPISLKEAQESGAGHPWQHRLVGVNPFSLAKHTSIPLVEWRARGGMGMPMILYHNSEAALSNPTLGKKWRHSWDINLLVGKTTAMLVWGDHKVQVWQNQGGAWQPSDGYHDTLESLDAKTYQLTLDSGQTLIFLESPKKTIPANYHLMTMFDENGNAIHCAYDNANRLVSVTDPNNRQLRFTYQNNKLVSVDFYVDSFFDVFYDFEYDNMGRLIKIKYPSVTSGGIQQNYTAEFTYDARDNITVLRDRLGNDWLYEYDVKDRCIAAQWPENLPTEKVQYQYDGNKRHIIDPIGVKLTYEYDALGRLVKKTDALDNETQYSYHTTAGLDYQLFRLTLPNSDYIELYYSPPPIVRITQLRDFNNQYWTMEYDARGRLIKTIEPLITDAWGIPAAYPNTTSYTYDANGNVVSVKRYTDPNNYIEATMTYDSYGNRTSIKDYNGNTWNYLYDSYGNLTKIITPEGRTKEWLYGTSMSTFGFILPDAIVDGSGVIKDLIRDEWGRLIQANEPQRTVTFEYNALNQLTSMHASNHPLPILFVYDKNTRLISAKAEEWTMDFGYLPNGYRALFSIMLLDMDPPYKITLNYKPDALNRLSEITDGTNKTTFTYDANSRLIQKQYSNGAATYYDYANGRLWKIAHTDSLGLPLASFTYSYQENGRLKIALETTILGGDATTRYGYDSFNRLIREQRTGSIFYDLLWKRDANGNKIEELKQGKVKYFTYDLDNALIAAYEPLGDVTNYSYDDNGRLRSVELNSQPRYSFEYNFDGQVTRLVDYSLFQDMFYEYDALNRRTGFMSYDFSGAQIYAEKWLSNDVVTTIDVIQQSVQGRVSVTYALWGNGLNQYVTLRGDVMEIGFPLIDGFGSTRMLGDESGNPTQYFSVYDAYGSRVLEQNENIRPPFAFQGDLGFMRQQNSDFITGAYGMYDSSVALCLPTGVSDFHPFIPWPDGIWDLLKAMAGIKSWEEDAIEVRSAGSCLVEQALKSERERIQKKVEKEVGAMFFSIEQIEEAEALEKQLCEESPIIQLVKQALTSDDPEVRVRAQDAMNKVFPPSELDGCVFTLDDK